jgi:hypothetical protein
VATGLFEAAAASTAMARLFRMTVNALCPLTRRTFPSSNITRLFFAHPFHALFSSRDNVFHSFESFMRALYTHFSQQMEIRCTMLEMKRRSPLSNRKQPQRNLQALLDAD